MDKQKLLRIEKLKEKIIRENERDKFKEILKKLQNIESINNQNYHIAICDMKTKLKKMEND